MKLIFVRSGSEILLCEFGEQPVTADDVTIHLALQQAGVLLVSATENTDEIPSGMLLHGIKSTIAEFYSRNLATEVTKGMTQKAIGGGTLRPSPADWPSANHGFPRAPPDARTLSNCRAACDSLSGSPRGSGSTMLDKSRYGPGVPQYDRSVLLVGPTVRFQDIPADRLPSTAAGSGP